MDDGQRQRLQQVKSAVEHASAVYEGARTARNRLFLELRARGVSVTAIARVVDMHRTRVQTIVSKAAGPPGGAGMSRGKQPTDDEAARLRAAQAAVLAAETARDDAFAARSDLYIALEAEGVGAVEQAEVLGLHRMSVQDVLDENRRALRRAQRRAGHDDDTGGTAGE